jgi:hypothetical protein
MKVKPTESYSQTTETFPRVSRVSQGEPWLIVEPKVSFEDKFVLSSAVLVGILVFLGLVSGYIT